MIQVVPSTWFKIKVRGVLQKSLAKKSRDRFGKKSLMDEISKVRWVEAG